MAFVVDEELRKNKIDVHAHFHSPELIKGLERIAGTLEGSGVALLRRKGETVMQQFTAEERVRWMDRFGIERSVLSFPSVSLYLGDEREVERPVERKEVCRFLNDLFAETHAKQPKRLHFFADVPLAVDVEFSCKELHRAVDDLGLQGIAIQSNLGGRLPSEPQFEEFFAEAAKMGVPIFMHPHAPYGREKMMKYWVFAIVGFTADVCLAATYMILDGFMERHPKIKIILPHLGGTLPYLSRRLTVFTEAGGADPVLTGRANLSKEPPEYLKHFYYDTALGHSAALELCAKVVGTDRIIFGTDHPYVDSCEARTIDYISRTSLTVVERDRIYSENARALFGFTDSPFR